MIIAKNSLAALNAVVAYAGLENYDIYGLTVVRQDSLYEIGFCTDVMEYCFLVDADTLETLGFDSSPVEPELSTAADTRCA